MTCDGPDFEKFEVANLVKSFVSEVESVSGIVAIESTPVGSGKLEIIDPTFSSIAEYKDEEGYVTQNLVGVVVASHVLLGLVRAYDDKKRGSHGVPLVTLIHPKPALDAPSAKNLGRLSHREEFHMPRKVRRELGLRKTNFCIGRVSAGGFFVQHNQGSSACRVLAMEKDAEPKHDPDNLLAYLPNTWALSPYAVQRALHIQQKPRMRRKPDYNNSKRRAARPAYSR